MRIRVCVIGATLTLCASLSAQTIPTVVIRGGQLFDGVLDHTVPNSGLVIRAGKFFEVGADLDGRE